VLICKQWFTILSYLMERNITFAQYHSNNDDVRYLTTIKMIEIAAEVGIIKKVSVYCTRHSIYRGFELHNIHLCNIISIVLWRSETEAKYICQVKSSQVKYAVSSGSCFVRE